MTFIEGRSIAKLGKKIQTRWELRTTQEGLARIPEIPQGKVRIQVVARGYQTFGQTFDIDQPDQTLTIKLNPPQPQYSVILTVTSGTLPASESAVSISLS